MYSDDRRSKPPKDTARKKEKMKNWLVCRVPTRISKRERIRRGETVSNLYVYIVMRREFCRCFICRSIAAFRSNVVNSPYSYKVYEPVYSSPRPV